MRQRYLSAIILSFVLLGAGSYFLVPSHGDIARAAPPPRPVSDAPSSANVRVDDGPGAYQPSIAVDPLGSAYAVWTDVRGPDAYRDIYFSYRPAGGGWGANESAASFSGVDNTPSIAVDASGNAYAAWTSDDWWSWYYVAFRYRPAGGPWGTFERVDDGTPFTWQSHPSIAVDASGNTYALYGDSRYPHVRFSYRPAGGSWGASVTVSDDTSGASQGLYSIAVDPTGNAYAAWQDARNGDWDIYFSYRPAGGAWGPNVRVNDDVGTALQAFPSIAVDSSGNAYSLWEDHRHDSVDIYLSYRPAGGNWGPNVKVNDHDIGSLPSTQPRVAIAVDPTGNAYAAWQDTRLGDSDIYCSYRPAGGAWTPNVRVNDDAGSAHQEWPSIAVDADGNAYVLWADTRDGDWHIYFSYRPAAQNCRPAAQAWNFSPPYDSCVASTAQLTESPPVGSPQVIALGFSDVNASCNPETGAINYSTLVFGGKKGHIFQPPSQLVKASADMGFEFTPPFTGSLNIEATVRVNAKLGAAAGSAMALLDFQDILLLFLPDKVLKAFIKIAEAAILETLASTETEAYIKVGEEESTVLVKSVVGSFPMPPWWQSRELSEEETSVSLTIPVVEGEPIYIQVGIRSETKAHGWASSWWNSRATQDSYVTSIILSREE